MPRDSRRRTLAVGRRLSSGVPKPLRRSSVWRHRCSWEEALHRKSNTLTWSST